MNEFPFTVATKRIKCLEIQFNKGREGPLQVELQTTPQGNKRRQKKKTFHPYR